MNCLLAVWWECLRQGHYPWTCPSRPAALRATHAAHLAAQRPPAPTEES